MGSPPSSRRKPDDCLPLISAIKRGRVVMRARARGTYPGDPLPSGCLPGLQTIGYWDAVGPQDWGLPMHRNEGIEICCLLAGQTAFATDSEHVMLRPGDVTITRPWQRHRLGDPNVRAGRLFWVILDVAGHRGDRAWEFPEWLGSDGDSRREMLRVFRANQCCHIPARDFALRDYLQSAIARMDDTGPLGSSRLAGIVNHVVLEIVTMLSKGIGRPTVDPHGFNQTIRSFFDGLERSPDTAAEPWTVTAIAQSCRVGVTYLTRITKELYNTTPSELVCRIRLEHAARLLTSCPERAITDIAFTTGFHSSQYFATLFRKEFGRTPGDYRLG
ncbi:MAG: AraC family transcriptional regulator [Verrucomicrobiaceae bacterium]|nr:MAG: AraC family transcriptional regulator [Verrucomicrobiaceae bacterium]